MPKLKRFDGEYIDAFYTLSRARQHGVGGPMAVTVQEVLAYCQLVGIDAPHERLKYLSILQRLDGVYLDFHAERASQNKKPS